MNAGLHVLFCFEYGGFECCCVHGIVHVSWWGLNVLCMRVEMCFFFVLLNTSLDDVGVECCCAY